MYISTKTYGYDIGLSCAFRQWRAESHCHFIHGYALKFRFEFEADTVDQTNWVVDFGSLKTIKNWLTDTFDHKLVVAVDDPAYKSFSLLGNQGFAYVVVVPATGCEAFAKLAYDYAECWLIENGHSPRVRMRLVEVCEHGANSAIYTGKEK